MHPITHLLTGWAVAESAKLGPRDRALVTLAAVLPDIDGLGVIAEIATEGSASPAYWWSEYHHVACHNLAFGLLLAATAAVFSVRRTVTSLLAVVAFHLHVLGDLVGSRGPDGYPWPISYLSPFSDRWQLRWDGQWALNAWPNIILTVVLLGLTMGLAWKRGHSPVGMVSARADAALIAALRKRFGEPRRIATETPEQRIQRVVAEEVAIAPYDPAWPELFRQEKAHLLACLPAGLVRRIEHFGSTAVPGLAAKPIVDMLVEVTDLQETRSRIAPILESQGYDYFWRPTHGDDGPPFYAWFIKRHPRTGARTHHIHMVESHFAGHWDRLLFRDYLAAHPDTAREYEALKVRLASASPGDRVAYTRGKSEFIDRVTERARRQAGEP